MNDLQKQLQCQSSDKTHALCQRPIEGKKEKKEKKTYAKHIKSIEKRRCPVSGISVVEMLCSGRVDFELTLRVTVCASCNISGRSW